VDLSGLGKPHCGAAATAGVRRIVYLGGLGRDGDRLSRHLQSRHDVGRVLASTGVEVVELRAGVIIGSGSASFEMLRYLVEVLPVMVTPRWVETRCQPIAITDVVDLLVEVVVATGIIGGVYEAGGPDVVTYAEMMALYAEIAGLAPRRLIRVPLLTPGLSSHWVGLVTPVPVPLARELVESLVNEVVVGDRSAAAAFSTTSMSLRESMGRALAAAEEGNVPTSFSDADLAVFRSTATDPHWSGGTVLKDVRTGITSAPPDVVFRYLEQIGGGKGWYAGERLWRVRGVLDQVLGGPGLRRGRRPMLAVGDALDFWGSRIAPGAYPRRLERAVGEHPDILTGSSSPPSIGGRLLPYRRRWPMIAARSLAKHYGKTVAVDDLSFDVTPGVVTGFLGPNGSGKSTTMRMIMGLDTPTSGSALVNGVPYRQLRWPLRQVGALLDAKAFHPARSARNHLLCPGPDERHPRRRVDEVLDIVGLTARWPTTGPASTRSGWDSASGSPAPCSATRPSCSSTSPSTASTPRASAGSATCCATWRPRAGRCSSPAT
jgi:hypothetical protein